MHMPKAQYDALRAEIEQEREIARVWRATADQRADEIELLRAALGRIATDTSGSFDHLQEIALAAAADDQTVSQPSVQAIAFAIENDADLDD